MNKEKNIAAIDIGSNTILMLIAKVKSNGGYEVITDEHSIARLGESVDRTGVINEIALERARIVLKKYKSICNSFDVSAIKAYATSAIRESKNGKEVALALSSEIGSSIKIISGEEEARLSFIGSIVSGNECTLIDIGGGSTEFICGKETNIKYRISVKAGAVKITENIFQTHPPTEGNIKLAEVHLDKVFNTIDKSNLKGNLYAVAGTPTTLAAISLGLKEYDNNKIDGIYLSLDFLERIFKKFLSMTPTEISLTYSIHPKRADVISAGTLILIKILKLLKRDFCIVSSKGLRYGILKTMLK